MGAEGASLAVPAALSISSANLATVGLRYISRMETLACGIRSLRAEDSCAMSSEFAPISSKK